MHESDQDTAIPVPANILHPHINNNIEYGLFEDVINIYYLDSQLKMILIVTKNAILTHNIHKKSNN